MYEDWDEPLEEKSAILQAYLSQEPAVRALFDAITHLPDVQLPRDIEDARQELEQAIWYLANRER